MGLRTSAGRLFGRYLTLDTPQARRRVRRISRAITEVLETRRYFSSIDYNQSNIPEHLYEGSYVEANQRWQLSGNDYGTISIDGGEPFWWWIQDDYDFSISRYFDDDGFTTSISITDNFGQTDGGSFTIENVQPVATMIYDPGDSGNDYSVSLIDPFDPSGVDTQAGFSYSFSTTYEGLGDSYSSTSYSSFDLQNSSGILWARIRDKDGGFSDYNNSYVMPTLNWTQVSSTAIGFSWNSNVASGETGWRIQRREQESGGGYSVWANFTAPAGSQSYTDTSVVAGKLYQYRVRAYGTPGTSGDTAYSAKRSVQALVPPTATLGLSRINGGTQVRGLLTGATDPRGETIKYSFATTPGGLKSYADSTTYSTSSPAQADFNVPSGVGSLTIYARVVDSSGARTDYSQAIPVNDLRPSGDITGEPNGVEGGTVHLGFINPTDPDGLPTKYAFAKAGQTLPTHYSSITSTLTDADIPFADNGIYTVTGRIIDSNDLYRDYSVTVNIANVSPTLHVSGNSQVKEGTPYTLSIAPAADPGTDTISSYQINWGDGQSIPVTPASGSSTFVSHTFTKSAINPIIVTATDEDGTYAADTVVLDPAFGISGVSTAQGFGCALNAMATQPDGKILIAGQGWFSGVTRFAVARFNADGTLDQNFGTAGLATASVGTYSNANAVLIQPDGNIILAGAANQSSFALARFLSNGQLDTHFGNGGTVLTDYGANGAKAAVLQGNKIVIVGEEGLRDILLARFLSDGSPDLSFGTNGKVTAASGDYEVATSLAIQSGKLLVGASSMWNGGFILARYTANGQVDSTFGSNGKLRTSLSADTMAAMVVDDQNRILAAGRSGADTAVLRYSSGGTLDNSFGIGGRKIIATNPVIYTGTLRGLAILPDKRIIVTGSQDGNLTILGLSPMDGALDTTIGTNGVARFSSSTLAPASTVVSADGAVYIAGGASAGGANINRFLFKPTVEVGVTDVAPATVAISGTATTTANSSYTATLSTSFNSAFDSIASWSVNWGDGASTPGTGAPASNSVQSHTYTSSGTYTVNVVDAFDGTYSKSMEVNVVSSSIIALLKASVVSTSAVKFSWSSPTLASLPSTLSLEKSVNGGAFAEAKAVNTANGTYQLNELAADQNYTFRLKSATGVSNEVTVRTPSGNVVYNNDFESGVPSEFSNAIISVTPKKNVKFLGEFGVDGTTFNFSAPSTSNKFLVSFDLYILRSWDGNDTGDGVDRWKWEVLKGSNNNAVTESPVDATFSNFDRPSYPNSHNDRQSFPENYSPTNTPAHPAQSDNVEHDRIDTAEADLGYHFNVIRRGDTRLESVYHIERMITAPDAPEGGMYPLNFRFSASGLQEMADESWGLDNFKVVALSSNTPPTVSFTESPTYQIPAQTNPPLGPVEVVKNDGTISSALNLPTSANSIDNVVRVAVGQNTSKKLPVDVFLLLDDTGSFSGTGSGIAAQLPSVIRDLKHSFPSIDLGVGVGRMEEYDAREHFDSGPGSNNSYLYTQDRPFILNQPIVHLGANDFASKDKGAKLSREEEAITAALNRKHYSLSENDQHGAINEYALSSTIEALYQVATGAGYDGDGDSKTTTHGNAGSYWAQVGNPVESPGTTELPQSAHDVPAFSSYSPDPRFKMLPPAGSIGGVGFRAGAIPIVIVATDSSLVYDTALGELPSTMIVGHPNGNAVSVPVSAFRAGSRYPENLGGGGGENGAPTPQWFPEPGPDGRHVRLGGISQGRYGTYQNGEGNSVEINGATLQQTIDALNAAGIKVVGLGGDTITRFSHDFTLKPGTTNTAEEHVVPNSPLPADEDPSQCSKLWQN